MSMSEVERFSRDLRESCELLRVVSDGAVGLDDLVSRARAQGYDFNLAEAEHYIDRQSVELSSEQLEATAGGVENRDVVIVDMTQATAVFTMILVHQHVSG